MHSCCLKITSEQLLNEVLFILFWQTVRPYGSNLSEIFEVLPKMLISGRILLGIHFKIYVFRIKAM